MKTYYTVPITPKTFANRSRVFNYSNLELFKFPTESFNLPTNSSHKDDLMQNDSVTRMIILCSQLTYGLVNFRNATSRCSNSE